MIQEDPSPSQEDARPSPNPDDDPARGQRDSQEPSAPEDLENDPAYSPDEETLKDIKGG